MSTQIVVLAESPVLHDLSPAFADLEEGRALYPPLMQYAVCVAARIYGSQRLALTELGSGDLWRRFCDAYQRGSRDIRPMPLKPPSAKQQDDFVARLTAYPGVLAGLSERFTEVAVHQARYQGNFAPGITPDYAKPDPRHVVMGDGMYLRPLSGVHWQTDKKTGEQTLVGSRAAERPRIQKRLTDPRRDKKKALGVNHVTLSTSTPSGWIMLAAEQSFTFEGDEAELLISRVHDLLGTGLHTVVWDRVLRSVHAQRLMAERGILLVTKPVARSSKSVKSDGVTAPVLKRQRALDDFECGRPLPLGTSVFRTSGNKPAEVVRTSYFMYGTLTGGCLHELWVDGGAIFDVALDSTTWWLVKVARATIVHAVPVTDAAGGPFVVQCEWRLPCSRAAGGGHLFNMAWVADPSAHGRPKRGVDQALYDVRPFTRHDQELFKKVHGMRNHTESYHSWLKRTLGDHGRAMRNDVSGQFLDHLCIGTLANTLTYVNHERLIARSLQSR
ncbi:hypothetical protein [Nocardioides taihuensis]|uniref:Transposase n=1 Tax=Nocardioides taihuensis TaxID=1835606 RepID=A0ABW0BEA2_9ACTN